jgi:hypothetical protein
MRNQATKSFELFEPGKKNGYWTNKDLVEQVQRVMPLFESLHQNSELVIVFDNSQNHHMTKEDGLDAGSLNLKNRKRCRLKSGMDISCATACASFNT